MAALKGPNFNVKNAITGQPAVRPLVRESDQSEDDAFRAVEGSTQAFDKAAKNAFGNRSDPLRVYGEEFVAAGAAQLRAIRAMTDRSARACAMLEQTLNFHHRDGHTSPDFLSPIVFDSNATFFSRLKGISGYMATACAVMFVAGVVFGHWHADGAVAATARLNELRSEAIEASSVVAQAKAGLLRQNFRVTPSYETAYQMGGDLPTECIHFMSMSFVSLWLAALGQIQGYLHYYMQGGSALWERGYRYHKRVLKLLQWKNPRQQWILKSPVHLGALPTLLRVYPDARIVWTHRDPVKAFASGLDLMGTLQWVRSDHPLRGGFAHLTDIEATAALLCAPIDWLESGVVPRSQLFNTLFQDFTDDPISAVMAIYDYFGMTLSQEGPLAMEAYMQSHPRAQRGHAYSDGPRNAILHEREVLGRYQNYFGVPNEA